MWHTRYLVLYQYCLVTTYVTLLWTAVNQRPYKLKCRVLTMYVSAALYRIRTAVINCTAFYVLRCNGGAVDRLSDFWSRDWELESNQAPLRINLGPVIETCVPLSPSSIIWYLSWTFFFSFFINSLRSAAAQWMVIKCIQEVRS